MLLLLMGYTVGSAYLKIASVQISKHIPVLWVWDLCFESCVYNFTSADLHDGFLGLLPDTPAFTS